MPRDIYSGLRPILSEGIYTMGLVSVLPAVIYNGLVAVCICDNIVLFT